ncbi:MAG: hypothetical protein JST93_13535 [Acidobacteria bacterium]|nr:hypothetical protein [Acidobacteriota bacterium]
MKTAIKCGVFLGLVCSAAQAQTVELDKRVVFVYDDSFQPPSCEWRNEGIFGTPSLHCGSWRALRHEITLVTHGPNYQGLAQTVQSCATQAILAGLAAAIPSKGAAAVPAFKSYLAGCVAYHFGNIANYLSVNLEDRSNWVDR